MGVDVIHSSRSVLSDHKVSHHLMRAMVLLGAVKTGCDNGMVQHEVVRTSH